ncbi:dUTP diphosphatase [Tuberibacillus sp. Marseille-P3662]|uniref:dUTP diphosphatase n=1 Tax=Tuberibacillus sp. Marseille-P3662 TaxID=1965358 RepID=UPI000A1CD92B|nr:dUTP diphosphatase [Tuberibacillus sp. Marseille-P3662]
MDLKQLFTMQAELDKHIVDEKGLEGQDLTQKKIIAFKVELGEFLNEWRGFKFWSKDQTPRISVPIKRWIGEIKRIVGFKNPLLEEYIDGVHFLLSIGIERGYDKWLEDQRKSDVSNSVTVMDFAEDIFNNPINSAGKWLKALLDYISLGKELGFSDEDIFNAYMDKNAVNHTRQESGY